VSANTGSCLGNGAANALEELRATFKDMPDLEFRAYPEAQIPWLRWQAGRKAVTIMEVDGYDMGFARVWELVAYAATPGALIDRIEALNGKVSH
jgi:hypothetical protein